MRMIFFGLVTFHLLACGGTEGKQVSYSVGIEANKPSGQWVVENDLGWRIELLKAEVRIGPLYMMEKSTAIGWLEKLEELIIPSAHAHAGDDFFSGGRTLGEWTRFESFDVIAEAPRKTLGQALGIEGNVKSFSLGFGKQPLHLKGVATRGTERVEFEFESVQGLHPTTDKVEFVPVDVALENDVRLFVEARWQTWFRGAKMETLTQDVSAPSTSQAYQAIHLNLRSSTAWTLRHE